MATHEHNTRRAFLKAIPSGMAAVALPAVAVAAEVKPELTVQERLHALMQEMRDIVNTQTPDGEQIDVLTVLSHPNSKEVMFIYGTKQWVYSTHRGGWKKVGA